MPAPHEPDKANGSGAVVYRGFRTHAV